MQGMERRMKRCLLLGLVSVVLSWAASDAQAHWFSRLFRLRSDPGVACKTFNVWVTNADLQTEVQEQWTFIDDGTLDVPGVGIGTYQDIIGPSQWWRSISFWTADIALDVDGSIETYQGISLWGRFLYGMGSNANGETLFVTGFREQTTAATP